MYVFGVEPGRHGLANGEGVCLSSEDRTLLTIHVEDKPRRYT